MEVEPSTANSSNASTVAVAKNTGERGWRMEKTKRLCVVFWLTRRSRFLGEREKEKKKEKKQAFWGIL